MADSVGTHAVDLGVSTFERVLQLKPWLVTASVCAILVFILVIAIHAWLAHRHTRHTSAHGQELEMVQIHMCPSLGFDRSAEESASFHSAEEIVSCPSEVIDVCTKTMPGMIAAITAICKDMLSIWSFSILSLRIVVARSTSSMFLSLSHVYLMIATACIFNSRAAGIRS